MTNAKYSLELHDVNAESPVVNIQLSSLAVVNFAAKDVQDDLAKSVHSVQLLRLIENKEGGFSSETLLDLTADSETVTEVLKVRLRRLRTEAKKADADLGPAAGAAENAGESAPAENPWSH